MSWRATAMVAALFPVAAGGLVVLLGCGSSTTATVTGNYLECSGLDAGKITFSPDGGVTITGNRIPGQPVKVIYGKIKVTRTID